MNEVILRGRLAASPRLQCLTGEQETPVYSILVAVDRDFPNNQGDYETDLIDCRVWGEYGKKKAGNCSKGDLVELVGALRVDEWRDGSGYHNQIYVRVDLIKRIGRVTGTQAAE